MKRLFYLSRKRILYQIVRLYRYGKVAGGIYVKGSRVHHAPDNYQWVWEVLKKSQTEDGKTQLEGNFFYSLNEDKSDPQTLEPGEYMYMYNVSERLFDEFLPETKGWSEIALYFSRNRNVSYSVINK